MSTYFGVNSSSVSTLFSSLNTSSFTGGTSMIADYASIRNGSYKKLLNAYYSETPSKGAVASSTSTAKDSTKLLSSIESSTDALKDSADTLIKTGTKSIFTAKDGKYDVDGIYDAVSKFVSEYNNVIEYKADSNNKNIASSSTSMITVTKANSTVLSKIGISMKTDGTLSLDKDKFKSSKMSTVKSIFNGAGSYGYQMSARASMINYYAGVEASKSNTYTSAGRYSYNYSAGDMMNRLY